MNKNSTLILYKSGRREVLFHKTKNDMEHARRLLEKLETVSFFRTPTREDFLWDRNRA